ncbi:MAG: glycosyltransferase, partial [Burkholderiales bacterium]
MTAETAKLPLTVAVIALNAEAQIGELLASVGFAGEVLVVDSGSTDATADVAAAHGARVIRKEWLGFGRQKQFAVSEASHDWVLCLDVDERVTPRLAQSIRRAIADPRFKAGRMARR